MKFPRDFVDKIVCGDVLETLRQMPDESIDLIVTSPPYNLKNSTGNGMKDGRGGKWANAALQRGYTHHGECRTSCYSTGQILFWGPPFVRLLFGSEWAALTSMLVIFCRRMRLYISS